MPLKNHSAALATSVGLFFLLTFGATTQAVADGPVVNFTNTADAAEFLAREDIYLKSFSDFDRTSRYGTRVPFTEDERIAFYGDKPRTWTAAETARLNRMMTGLLHDMKLLELAMPDRIEMIKTNGGEEGHGGAPYTRMNAIILPDSYLDRIPDSHLAFTLAHELFHIFSRHHREQRDQLYAVIGFRPVPEPDYPGMMKTLRITNPDAPVNRHAFQAGYKGKHYHFIPVIFAVRPFETGGEATLFDYLQSAMMAVDITQSPSLPVMIGGEPLLVPFRQLPDFQRLTGGNTNYTFHPEEILADNFALLITNRRVRTRDVPERLLEAMRRVSR